MNPLTFWTGLALASAILVVLQAISWLALRRTPDSSGWSRFHARASDWWYVLLAIAASYALGAGALIFIFALASFMAFREIVSATPVAPSDANPLLLAFFVAVPGQYILLSFRAYGLFSIFIPVYVFFALTALAVFAKDTDKANFLARNARIQWALMVTVYGVSFAPALLTLAPAGRPSDGMMLFFLLFVGQLSETIHFLASRSFGKRSISSRIEDATLEGALTAAGASFLLGWAICAATPFAWWQAGLMGVAISVSGLCGRLALVAAKESLGIKRWRPTSEARGGMVERLDAISFSAPIFFHLAKTFYPG